MSKNIIQHNFNFDNASVRTMKESNVYFAISMMLGYLFAEKYGLGTFYTLWFIGFIFWLFRPGPKASHVKEPEFVETARSDQS